MPLSQKGIQLCPTISNSVQHMMSAVNMASNLSVLWEWSSLVVPLDFHGFL